MTGVKAGSDAMRQYAERIGADYLFEDNPKFVTNLGGYSPHFGSFKPIYTESFHIYDNILFTDTDVFPVKGLEESIFENFNAEMGICTEPHQPQQRAKRTSGVATGKRDEEWATVIYNKWKVKLPRNDEGLLKVYNSGVVLYSNKGLLKARENFVPFKTYIDLMKAKKIRGLYHSDQNYVHAMLKVAKMDYVELDNNWNSYVHYIGDPNLGTKRPVNDMRTANTKFVHIQLRGADRYDMATLQRITNLPLSEWNL